MDDITRQQLIGLKIKIVDAKNSANKNIEGMIINETKNTIKVQTNKETKTLIKKDVTIQFIDKQLNVVGELLVGRPEERIKKKRKT